MDKISEKNETCLSIRMLTFRRCSRGRCVTDCLPTLKMTTAKRHTYYIHTHIPHHCDQSFFPFTFFYHFATFFKLDFNWNKLTRDYLRALVNVNAVHRPKFRVHFTHAPTWIHVINGSGISKTLDFISSFVRCCPFRMKTFLCDTLRQMHVLHLQFKCVKVEKKLQSIFYDIM